MLASHQNVLAKLRSEIGGVVGLGSHAPQPKKEDLKRMPFLNNIIKEGMKTAHHASFQ